jgi:aldose 1-epimerase
VTAVVAPTGEQFEISGGGYRAVVTEGGATLRLLDHEDRPIVDGFAEDAMPSVGRGQLLMPWPNRIRDGHYAFGGRELQLGLSEAARGHASHGLVRWAAWTLEELSPGSVSLTYLSADGLTVTQTATNLSPEQVPFASGAHPYLKVGAGPVNDWELTLPASTRLVTDERLIPVDEEAVEETPYDFRVSRPVRDTVIDHAFGDLDRDGDGVATVALRDPGSGDGVALWMDERHRWIQVFTAELDPVPRRALAVEPMTSPPDAYRSGRDLVVLSPAGQDGDEFSGSWGIRALA